MYHHSPLTESARPKHEPTPKPELMNSHNPSRRNNSMRKQSSTLVLSSHPVQRQRHCCSLQRASHGRVATYSKRRPKGTHRTRFPISGHEPNTNSTLPILMHPKHGNSLQAPFVLLTTPLIGVDLTSVLHSTGFVWPSETAPISDAHP